MYKAFALLNNADDLAENAWRERRWQNFVYLCLAATVGVMIVGFLVCIIGGGIYLEALRAYWLIKSWINPAGGIGALLTIPSQYSALFYFALSFSAIAGFFALISAAPAMLVKGIVTPLSDLLFSFEGRITRIHWLLTAVAMMGIMLVLVISINVLGGILGDSAYPAARAGLDLLWLVLLILLVPSTWVGLAISFKRLHDRNKSPLWLLVFFVLPLVLYVVGLVKGLEDYSQYLLIGSIAIAIWGLVEIGILRGTAGPNHYGPEPLEGSA